MDFVIRLAERFFYILIRRQALKKHKKASAPKIGIFCCLFFILKAFFFIKKTTFALKKLIYLSILDLRFHHEDFRALKKSSRKNTSCFSECLFKIELFSKFIENISIQSDKNLSLHPLQWIF